MVVAMYLSFDGLYQPNDAQLARVATTFVLRDNPPPNAEP